MKKSSIFDIDNEFEKRCCFTGYRPGKLPFAPEKDINEYRNFENSLIETVFSLTDDDCYTFITGMAMGFDIIAAEAVLLLKKGDPRVRLICVLPFSSQREGFPRDWQERYDRITENADEIVIISENYFRGCYFRRNDYMVDNSDYVVTWFDGQSGGTAATLNYARKKGRHIINLNKDFKKYGGEWMNVEMDIGV